MGLKKLFKSAWNVFANKDPTSAEFLNIGPSYSFTSKSSNPYYVKNDRSMLNSIINKMAMDAAAIPLKEVIIDSEGRFVSYPSDSSINERLSVSANLDETGSSFRLHAITSCLEEGVIALVPTDADMDPDDGLAFKIYEVRVGHIKEWYPQHVRMEVYDERTGEEKEVIMQKASLVIVQNPMYEVMNAPSSTMQRIMKKFSLLDVVDEELRGNKLNMIIQLPYVIKTPARQAQAEARKKAIEEQLSDNKYGIAYIDSTEKITQLNRPLENNLIAQIEYLMNLFMTQIGITPEILNGTASPEVMNNYLNRPIDWILTAFADEIYRKWLTPTARTQLHSIKYFRDPFRLAPINNVADMADKFIRNEIMTKNEFRQVLGMKPSGDPAADRLRNPNISESNVQQQQDAGVYDQNQNGYDQYNDQQYDY